MFGEHDTNVSDRWIAFSERDHPPQCQKAFRLVAVPTVTPPLAIAFGERDPPARFARARSTYAIQLDHAFAPAYFPAMFKQFPRRLHHEMPGWVPAGAVFHIRIRCADHVSVPLTEPTVARALLDSARFYHNRQQWHVRLFLLMPDHLHALLVFPPEERMSEVIRNWKRFHAKQHGVRWQENYFDHRLRNEEEQTEKYHYILNNPVVKGLCERPEDWPWVIRDADLVQDE